MKIIAAPTAANAAALAAGWVARRIKSAVRSRDLCTFAVSGGATPALMFDGLAAMDLPWSAVHILQVDERVAPDGHPDRNAVQLTEHLLTRVPIPEQNIHLMPVTAGDLQSAAAAYAQALGDGPLDIVHLGIGDDGHTASWPPGDDVIDDPRPVAVSHEYNGRIRMTLTPPVVNAARARMVLVAGESKAAALASWLEQGADVPIARVRRGGTTVIVDADGASRLTLT
jgi:6-phosphogluconolactonase